MAYYKIRYAMAEDGTLRYPESLRGIVWQFAAYHRAEASMIGKTRARISTEDAAVWRLRGAEARRLIGECRSSYAEPRRDLGLLGPASPPTSTRT